MRILIVLLSLLPFATSQAAGGYEITVSIDGYSYNEMYLGYYFGDTQYVRDTVEVNATGDYVFRGEESLPPGVYMVILKPDYQYFEILINEGEQALHFSSDLADLNGSMVVSGEDSLDNQLFYEYMRFLDDQRAVGETLNAQFDATDDEATKNSIQAEAMKLDDAVKEYRNKLVTDHPNTFTAVLIPASMPINVPEFEGEDADQKRWNYLKTHFFDHVDLGDPRMLRTPMLYKQIDYFINELQNQTPDTLAYALDELLPQMEPAPETYQFYLIHFVNQYATSKTVGMDAVYVHLVNNYYAKGKAPWMDPEQLEKMQTNAQRIEPLLIGKIAPDVTLQMRDGSSIRIHDVQTTYTVLYFWKEACGTCEKYIPDLKEALANYASKGLTIVAVNTGGTDDLPSAWAYVDEKELGDWIHVADPNNTAKVTETYDVRSTPRLYLLGENKQILAKQFGANQLPEVLDFYINLE